MTGRARTPRPIDGKTERRARGEGWRAAPARLPSAPDGKNCSSTVNRQLTLWDAA